VSSNQTERPSIEHAWKGLMRQMVRRNMNLATGARAMISVLRQRYRSG